MQTLGRAEELLFVQLLRRALAARPLQRPLVVVGGTHRLAVAASLQPREDQATARRPADLLPVALLLQPEDEDVVEAEPLDRGRRHHVDRARRARLLGVLALDPGLGDGAQVGDEAAGRAVRLAPRPGRRQLGQAREPEQALGDLRLGGEEALPPQPDLLDQPPHEDVGPPFLHRRRGAVVELEEGPDPLPRLGLELGAVEGGFAGGDHVQLAAPGDRRQPRQVGGAQLDRRPGQRPRRRGRVVGGGEHPQPGDRVAHLGPLEQRRRPGEVEGDAPLFHSRGDGDALLAGVGDQHADLFRGGAGGDQVLDLARHRLRLRALVGAAPEGQLGVAEAPLEQDPLAAGVQAGEPIVAEPALGLGVALLEGEDLVRVVGGERLQHRSLRRGRLLQFVDGEESEALGDPPPHVGALDQQAVEGEEDVAAVEAAGLGDDPVVGGVEVGELALAPRRLALGLVAGGGLPRPRPLGERRRSHPFGLQPVDPGQQPGQQTGRVAADLVPAQRQPVEAVEQQRQPLAPAQHVEEGVEPGLLGVVAQDPLADRVPAADPELLERPLQQRLAAFAQAAGGGLAGGDHQHALGPRPGRDQAGEAAGEQLGLAGARGAEDQQRPLAVGDRAIAL